LFEITVKNEVGRKLLYRKRKDGVGEPEVSPAVPVQ
jgi:hypothetical protein